jgi:hypothetical protein
MKKNIFSTLIHLPFRRIKELLPAIFLLTAFTGLYAQTNTGKDFWLAETPNWPIFSNFAISVANPGATPANITITNPVRPTVNATIAPGSLQTFTFSTENANIRVTNKYVNNVYHVSSDNDIVVYDFTPLVNVQTNDASLILPTNSLGKKYFTASYVNPLGNTSEPFIGVVATENNTMVNVYNRSGILMNSILLNQGEYFQRVNSPVVSQDATGWFVETDKPAAVFSGNFCTSVGTGTAACDHIDEQILPLESMASAYIASPTNTRPIGCAFGTCAPDIFRYIATEDNTVITTSPNVGGGILNKGDWIEITTNKPHVVSSNNKPFYGYQYLISQGSGSPTAGTGDPSLLAMPPVDQFQFAYLFLVPNTFAFDFINVVAPLGTAFTLDGTAVSPPCHPAGTLDGTSYCTFALRVADGVHNISANNRFGLSISGFDNFASYAYLGGVGLQPLNAGCNTGGPYQVTTCSLSGIQLTGDATCSDGSTPTNIEWSSSDGVIFSDPNISNPTATVPGYGTFNICLTVSCGDKTVRCCSQLTVNEPAGGCNTPPVAICQPLTIAANANCQGLAAAAAFNNGSTDNEGDELSFSVAPAGPYALGTTNVILTVTDSKGASSTCATTITVVDEEKPSITAPANVNVSADNSCSASNVALGTPVTADNCSVASVTNDAPAVFPAGSTTVTWTVTDGSGNTATATQVVTVADITPPNIVVSDPSPNVMWPPNHSMRDVTINYTATDNCSFNCTITDISSNEPVNGLGDGDTAPDWEFVDNTHVKLRAERSGLGEGRTYTITITCTDASGNSTSKQVTVTVPKSQKNSQIITRSNNNGSTPEVQAINNAKLKINVFPNPTSNNLTVQLGNVTSAKAEVTLTNTAGVIIAQNSARLNGNRQVTMSFDLKRYPAGIYVLKVITAEGTQTSKVMIQR